MGLKIVIYFHNCGLIIYYCADNRDFLGDFEVVRTEDFSELSDIITNFPFVKTSW
ncbi:p6.3 [Bean yellow disorder virus]|uniref:p6.3 n=1 Tax=Bean yellow disorder virus TaxID=267970 RepID=B2BZW7_9CLOS|nr:p6.3 [Bean yellow disorder virus]ABY66966.1 p6.3 [Bean yellow disorder virus]